VPENVTLVALPRYSPELNPVERVWLFVKERFFNMGCITMTTAIVNAACKAWRRLTAEAGRLKSLCTYLGSQRSRVRMARSLRSASTAFPAT